MVVGLSHFSPNSCLSVLLDTVDTFWKVTAAASNSTWFIKLTLNTENQGPHSDQHLNMKLVKKEEKKKTMRKIGNLPLYF